jgi:hypothetical protein
LFGWLFDRSLCLTQTAADLMNEARELDTADRYLNSKCVKYMLRAGAYRAPYAPQASLGTQINDPKVARRQGGKQPRDLNV